MTPFFKKNFKIFYLVHLVVFICCLSLGAGPLPAAESTIKTVMDAAKSVVSIKSETGQVYGARSKPYLIKETGQIIVRSKIMPFKYDRTGAGVIIDASGIIAANHHTTNQAGRVTVVFYNGMEAIAEIVELVREHDLALLRVKPPFPLTPIPFGDSDKLTLDQVVYSIGNSTLLKNTISEGKITGLGQSKQELNPGDIRVNMLQINFGLYKGDSGTPVIDKNGGLLGFISAGAQPINKITYAIPSNIIKKYFLDYSNKLVKKQTT